VTMPLDDAVRADDELIERLRTGGQPPIPADPLWVYLAAWRDFVQGQPADRSVLTGWTGDR
jgi:hypothetical protein